jgi:Cu+-exporting ATPase
MHCAGCVNSIQKHIFTLDSVSKVEVNLANEKAVVEFDSAKVGLHEIEKAIDEVGYRVIYEKVSMKVEGITDVEDARRLEEAISRREGVRSVFANFGNAQLHVEYNTALVSLGDIRKKVGDYGYTIIAESTEGSTNEIEARKLKNLFLLGIAFAIPAVLFSYPEVFSFLPLSATNAAAYIAFSAASIVQFVTGKRFYSNTPE